MFLLTAFNSLQCVVDASASGDSNRGERSDRTSTGQVLLLEVKAHRIGTGAHVDGYAFSDL